MLRVRLVEARGVRPGRHARRHAARAVDAALRPTRPLLLVLGTDEVSMRIVYPGKLPGEVEVLCAGTCKAVFIANRDDCLPLPASDRSLRAWAVRCPTCGYSAEIDKNRVPSWERELLS